VSRPAGGLGVSPETTLIENKGDSGTPKLDRGPTDASGRAVLAVLFLAVLWAALFSYLAIARHDAFESNAFDLGYVTQTLWYTDHGQPFRFTTIDGLPVSPEGTLDVRQLHQPPSLLAFHVEPLLLLVAPIFAIWPDSRLLLVLQAAALAAGGVVAAALARARLGDPSAVVVFGIAFLLSPSVAAASQSDFHAVSLAASLGLATIYCLATGRKRLALVGALLTTAGREDAALLMTALGAYLFIRGEIARRRATTGTASDRSPFDGYRDLGLRIFLVAGGWTVIAFGLIMPFFNGTIAAIRRGEPAMGSIFWHRYTWLGASPLAALVNIARDPGLLINWFGQGDVQAFLATLVLSGGVLALLAPDLLLVASPIIAMNALSSFDWMRSGGAHYSVIIIPILIAAGIEGTRRLRARIHGRGAQWGALAVVLLAALANHVWLGASPLVPGLTWPTPGPRQQAVEAILAKIPSAASVSATSGVYPHLASRPQAYWYPAINGADYLAIDAVSSSNPIGRRELQARVTATLASGSYRVAAAAPGFLLLERANLFGGVEESAVSNEIPNQFYDFARATPAERDRATALPDIRFGSGLHLAGYRVEKLPTQTVFGPTARVTTFWRLDQPLRQDLNFVFYPTRRSDGAIVGDLRDAAPEAIWYPTSKWQTNETVTLTILLPRERDLQAVGVAVEDPTTGRLPIEASPTAVLWDHRKIAQITRFDEGK